LLLLSVIITSCGLLGGGSNSDVSSTTGWSYNDPEMGGFEVKAKL
jgi:hypothetical protein